jgi:AraC-like DNA-binding protein
VVTKGQIKRSSGNWEVTLNPGDLFLCGIWEPHQSYILKAPHECCILHLDPVYLSQQFSSAKGYNLLSPFLLPVDQRPHPCSQHASHWLDYVDRLKALDEKKVLNRSLKITHIALELLADLSELCPSDSTIKNNQTSDLPNMSKLFEIVFQQKGSVSLEEASKIQKMNKNKFCKVFLQTMGMTFNHFCLNYRLSEVERELRMSDVPIKKVAYNWGFSDTSHLNKYFKKKYAESPQVYRDRFL